VTVGFQNCDVATIAAYLRYRIFCQALQWRIGRISARNSAEKEMMNEIYGKHMKKILVKLGLSCSKLLLLGRNRSARIENC
jgi:hypothetical protein